MNDKIFYVLVTVFTLVLFGGILFLATKPSVTNQNPNQQVTLDPQELIGDARNSSLSIEDAKVTVVEFGDFQCPACKAAWSEVARIKDDFSDSVAVVYRHFPLTNIHNYAFNAAVASEAAAEQGKFFEYHDTLFRNQSDNTTPLSEDDYVTYAEELGLDVEKFRQDLSSDELRDRVRQDMSYGDSIGINSTPTFFVNGTRVDYPQLYETVQNLVNVEEVEQTSDEVEESVDVEVSPTEASVE